MDNNLAVIAPVEMDVVPAMPDNLPRWATDNYPEAAEDFSKWMLQVQYQALPPGTSETVRGRMAQALANSLKATFNLQEVMERAKVLQLWNAQKTGWYHLLPQRYDTAAIFLKELMGDAGHSETVDLTFMVESLLPACEFLGIPAETIVCFPAYYSKARAAVPALRDAWRAMDSRYRAKLHVGHNETGYTWTCGGVGSSGFDTKEKALQDYQRVIYTILTEDDRMEFTEMIHTVIQMIPKKMSVRDFEKEMYELRGVKQKPKELATSMVIILPGGKELHIIRSPNSGITKRIEHQIESLTVGPASIRDATYLSKEVREWFDYTVDMGTYFYDLSREGLVEDPTGIILPRPDGIKDLIRIEIAKAMPTIEQVFRRGVTSWDVPIYSILSTGVHVTQLICARFNLRFNREEDELNFAVRLLPDALYEFYKEGFERAIQDALPGNMMADLHVDSIPENDTWGVYVTVRNMSQIVAL